MHYKNGKQISDCPILLTETLAIRKALMKAINGNLSKFIIESDY